ncbi:ATP-dependent DNA helicase [Haloarcula sp. CBA1130]|uniref:ATP-dependent DNA helicase n=1 Tax=unclassified Haloarcula TaxID=2624677 RepID=UPI00124652C6|nr:MULTISPECIES: ATP-dependent DNA helicase [unclassified Haloarcula]KAA9399417.1 ATP-dependent DNA helicase [Haloarcula sp. CBA1129]KAA9403932.1 ATP-dependent DNA helicase [Haloarcula sp. CBA1130]
MATTDDGYMRFFPFEEPYDHQQEAMGTIYDALEEGHDVLFEGACGTGKTLASLVPALEHARETGKTVVITTNVHQQMRQFVEDARAITDQERLRAVVFRGKGSMCHIDVDYEECQALRDTTRDLVEVESDIAELEQREGELLSDGQAGSSEAMEARNAVVEELRDLQDEREEIETERSTCDHYYRNLTVDTSEFYAWLFDDVRTPDDVYEYAHEQGLCGYELLKEGMDGVDLVVCNYHHLLDPTIREQFFHWIGRDPEDIIAVFDEAHNVESAARDHARRTLTENTLDQALEELDNEEDARTDAAANVIETFRDALIEAYEDAFEFGGRAAVDEHWDDITIANDDRKDDLTLAFLQGYTGPGFHEELDRALELGRDLDARYQEAFKQGELDTRKECQTLQAAGFISDWLEESDDTGQYPVVSVRRDESTDDVYGRAELYTCIPEEVTRDLFEDLHAAVLMSATLRPFDVTENVVGVEDAVTMAYGAQFPEERRRTYAVDGPALFSSERDDPQTQQRIARTLEDIVRFTPGNTLVFCPSYSEAERYHDMTAVSATRYLDEPGTQARDLREAFTNGDDGVLYTSLWGTLGEGVSYDGDDARTVVVVGVPYPHLDDRMDAVQDAYDVAFGDDEGDAGWRYAVEIPTVRKTRQALGRVVRSPDDFGARILLDKRYTEAAEMEMHDYAVRGTFPTEERREMVDIGPEKLKFAMLNFYQDMDAYDGPPPKP